MRLATLFRSLVLAVLLAGNAVATERVDINTADAAAIDRALVNIGPAKAEAIVAYREFHGPFRSVEELALVKGIGLKTIEKNRDRVIVGRAVRRATDEARRVPVAARR